MNKKSAFTLIEIIVSVTILSLIMVSVFEIYATVLSLSKRLELSRIMQENARSATEILAKEIRDYGIDLWYYDASTADLTLDREHGNSILVVKGPFWSKIMYQLFEETPSGPIRCSDPIQKICYLWREAFASDGTSHIVRISDGRVRFEHLRFFVSGITSDTIEAGKTEARATILFDLRITNGSGLDPSVLSGATLKVQTTLTEKIYKNNRYEN